MESYLSVKEEKSKIFAEMFYDGKAEYAFYLLKNNVRIDTIWYGTNNKAEFDLNSTGEYKIVCFVKEKGNITLIKESETILFYKEEKAEEVDEISDLNLSIFGSCVSRDILEYGRFLSGGG